MVILCFLIMLVFSAVAFLLYRKSKKIKGFTKSTSLVLLAILLFSVGLEASIFNINYYTTRGYTPVNVNKYVEDYKNDEGIYVFPGGEEIEFLDVNEKIHNIHIELDEDNKPTVNVVVCLTDEANEFYFATPCRTLYRDIDKGKYINVHTSGISQNFEFVFNGTNEDLKSAGKITSLTDTFVNVKNITINSQRDFDFMIIRVAIICAILVFIYIFRPKSPIYSQKLLKNGELKNDITLGFIALECIIIAFVGTMNPAFLGMTATDSGIEFESLYMKNHNQYDELAQALLKGRTHIDNNDIPQSLKDMKNPYDTTARQYNQILTEDEYRWDVAYFNEHYYVYFGIVPALLLYLPFRAIFDSPFPTTLGVIGFGIIFSVGVFLLLGMLCRKYFKKTSVGAYLLTALAFVNCCGAMFLIKRPDFYAVPIITSMAFIVWGIYFWLKGRDTDKKQNLYLFIGSLLCALSVGCRPQSVLILLLALPIFGGYFFKEKNLKQKSGIVNLISLAIPFIVVASGLMYYNYIRFGSPFDFGSSYNLTTNDVTRRGIELGRTGLGLFTYLFQLPNVTSVFPYITDVDMHSNYVGKTIAENCYGGLIACTPVLWSLFMLPYAKTKLKEKGFFGFTVTAIIIGVALVIVDTQAGGLLQRYFSDFGYIFFMAATFIIFALCETSENEKNHKNFHLFLFISTILSIVYTIALVFSKSDGTIDTQNPDLYGYVLHMVEFWL